MYINRFDMVTQYTNKKYNNKDINNYYTYTPMILRTRISTLTLRGKLSSSMGHTDPAPALGVAAEAFAIRGLIEKILDFETLSL